MKALTAGSEIDSWCTRCKLDLGHRIVAMVKGQPKRVLCQTCGSEHNYRAPRTLDKSGVVRRGSAAPAAQKPRANSPSSRAKAEHDRIHEWEKKILGQAATAFSRYSIERKFKVGELILHRKFGEGYVTNVLEDGKIAVMFRDGERTLAHGHA
jgi:hypothetical protein